MKETEDIKFIKYSKVCGDSVAIMRDGREEWPINKKCLAGRLKTLKRNKRPYNETERALKDFPR